MLDKCVIKAETIAGEYRIVYWKVNVELNYLKFEHEVENEDDSTQVNSVRTKHRATFLFKKDKC